MAEIPPGWYYFLLKAWVPYFRVLGLLSLFGRLLPEGAIVPFAGNLAFGAFGWHWGPSFFGLWGEFLPPGGPLGVWLEGPSCGPALGKIVRD